MPANDPRERVLQARVAAFTRWANADPAIEMARVIAASPAALDYWQRKVDPDNALPVPERDRRAVAAKKAHYTRLALLSARARRKPR